MSRIGQAAADVTGAPSGAGGPIRRAPRAIRSHAESFGVPWEMTCQKLPRAGRSVGCVYSALGPATLAGAVTTYVFAFAVGLISPAVYTVMSSLPSPSATHT